MIEKEVFTETDPYRILGFKDSNGTTSYYSANITSSDAKKVDEFCQEKKISPLNTRLIKLKEGEYELRIASSEASTEKTPYLKTYSHTLSEENGGETITVHVKAGDFKEIMSRVVESMQEAYKHVANENQENMVREYIEHFRYGEYAFKLLVNTLL